MNVIVKFHSTIIAKDADIVPSIEDATRDICEAIKEYLLLGKDEAIITIDEIDVVH